MDLYVEDTRGEIAMTLAFTETTKTTMIVMDGSKPVAKARLWGMGWWLLTVENGSWLDPRARESIRDDLPKGFKDLFSSYPNMLAVKSRAEARKIMQALSETGAVGRRKPHRGKELTGDQVKQARSELGLTAAAAAAAFGLNDGAAWRKWERNGVSGPAALMIGLCLQSPEARVYLGLS